MQMTPRSSCRELAMLWDISGVMIAIRCWPAGRAGAGWPGRAAGGRGGLLSLTADQGGSRGMAWSWQFEKEDGTVAASRGLPKETFSSQGDAESWLGENWRELLEGGVDQVTLVEEERVEYGPMSLRPAS